MKDTPVRKRFGSFGVRLAAVCLDFVLVFILAAYALNSFPDDMNIPVIVDRTVFPVVLVLYFASWWVSPLRATPVQLLFGLRVISERGGRLTFVRAVVRAAILVVFVVLALLGLEMPPNPVFLAAALVAYAAVYLATATPLRQGVHDLAAGSLVVNRTFANQDPREWPREKPSPFVMAGNLLVLAAPVIVLHIVASAMNDRDMLSRTYYAVTETGILQTEVEFFFEAEGRFPVDHVELDIPPSHNYPDGGYFELLEDGVIRIKFEIKPELKDGEILLVPVPDDGTVEWHCRVEGNIHPKHAPSRCREQ